MISGLCNPARGIHRNGLEEPGWLDCAASAEAKEGKAWRQMPLVGKGAQPGAGNRHPAAVRQNWLDRQMQEAQVQRRPMRDRSLDRRRCCGCASWHRRKPVDSGHHDYAGMVGLGRLRVLDGRRFVIAELQACGLAGTVMALGPAGAIVVALFTTKRRSGMRATFDGITSRGQSCRVRPMPVRLSLASIGHSCQQGQYPSQ